MTKETTEHTVEEHLPSKSADHVEEAVLASLTEDDVWKISQQSLNMYSWTGVRICLILFVQGCNQAGYGIDWAVISGINAFDSWHDFFGLQSSGHSLGLINALMNIGNVCGAPFLALSDVIGRRAVNFIGNIFIIAASIMQATAPNLKVFMAGRFFMGFGSALLSSSQYMGEISPVHLRGLLVGIFGACFQIGSLSMTSAMIGFTKLEGDIQWRLPLYLNMVFPVIVCLGMFTLCPESPRYYIMRGKRDAARRVIAKYHTTSGDLDQPIVNIVTSQMEASIENDRQIKHQKFWDYSVFLTRTVRYRLLVLVLYSVFQQWNGGGIITYYMVPALETIGIDGSMEQLGIQLGTTATYFVFTAVGALIIDRIRRRTMIFIGLATMILFQTTTTITSWQYDVGGSKAAAALTILWIYLYQTCSAIFIATMHNLYPIEILSLPLRAKGMALYGLIQGGAGAVQTYGISVGIGKIGYKIWVVYIVYNTVQLVLSYFVFPETSGLSLEEIDAVFETPGVAPVKMSMDIYKAKKEMARANREDEDRA
ncbi:general substrate transporter [Aspergillus karnatakaensis]|uniref:putative MFS sugar transporter protein n=1 Tax=Aspergillus karnatakaensis TaxID=1810916 RepID=UPI003CCCB60B